MWFLFCIDLCKNFLEIEIFKILVTDRSIISVVLPLQKWSLYVDPDFHNFLLSLVCNQL